MASKTYTVASEEGVEFAHEEIGAVVELDLSKEQETALVAAGWLKPSKKKEN